MRVVGILNVGEKNMQYAAIYMPSCSEEEDPSKYNFETKEKAKEYMVSRFCEECKKNYEKLNSKDYNPNDEEHLFCSCDAE